MRTIITPDMAKEYLKNDNRNRQIPKSSLIFLEEQIKTGKFINGSTIVISKDGEVIDGQHRLMACVNTNMPIDIELIEGVDFNVFKTIDTGKPRGAKDIFSIEGIANPNVISAVCNASLNILGLRIKGIKGKNIKYSHDEILNHYIKYEADIKEAFDILYPLYGRYKTLPPSFSIAIAHILNRYIRDRRGTEFIRQVFNGVQETTSNVPLVIRNRLFKNAMSNNGKLSNKQKRNMLINGFKGYIVGR